MDFSLPPVGEGLYEVELVRWLVRPGDAVAPGQGLMEVMSDKATMEVPAAFSGTVTGLAAEPGSKVKVGQVVMTYNPVGGAEPNPPAPFPGKEGGESSRQGLSTSLSRGGVGEGSRPAVANGNGHAVAPPAAPSVRLLARKLGIDLARIRGSGPHGRILLDDLTPYLARPADRAAKPEKAGQTDTSKLDLGVAGTRVKLAGLRRKIAEHLVDAKRRIPHYSYIDECDLTDLVRLRDQLREPFVRAGVKLTYLAFFVKAVARSLREVPVVNASLDEAAGEIVLHDRYHVGVAVAAPGGLIVPVVRDADKKDLAAVAGDIERLSADARAGKARVEDLRGGTFTVTSIGGIGGLISTPIINHPEVGIMGIGKVQKRPVYGPDGGLRPADLIYLSFSFDHRVVDGAVGAAFGNAVVRHLRAPATLLLPEKFGG